MNPKGYGAMTFYDHARFRLSVFTREEAEAIVAYLQHKRDGAQYDFEREPIDAALNLYWLERSQTSPLAESLRQHIAEQAAYLAAMADEKST